MSNGGYVHVPQIIYKRKRGEKAKYKKDVTCNQKQYTARR